MNWQVQIGAKSHVIALPEGISDNAEFAVVLNGRTVRAKWQRETRTLFVLDPKKGEAWTSLNTRLKAVTKFPGESDAGVSIEFTPAGGKTAICVEATVGLLVPGSGEQSAHKAQKPKVVRSQITGKVLKVLIKVGDSVTAGDTLMVIEAMKMENRITTSSPGIVEVVGATEGAMVTVGCELVRLK